MKIVATSGYFDPLHVGHLECLKLARELGDKLIVIINNDLQAKLKKGKSFMSQEDRMKIVGALACVDEVLLSRIRLLKLSFVSVVIFGLLTLFLKR